MFQFRSEFSNIKRKLLYPRIVIWALAFITLFFGYFVKNGSFQKEELLVLFVTLFVVFLTNIPILFVGKERKFNFYYAFFLSIIDPLCVSLLSLYFPKFHFQFIVLYTLALVFSGIYLNKIGIYFITGFISFFYLLSTYHNHTHSSYYLQSVIVIIFFFVSNVIIFLKDYLKNIIRHLRIKDQNISTLEFFNIYLVNNLENALIAVDERLNVSFWSGSAEDILKVSHESIIGKNLKDFYPELAKFCVTKNSDHIESWQKIDGKKVCLSLKVSTIYVENEFVGNILVIEDITRFKEAQKLHERNKNLASIGRLAATLAHEIRNPLASISGSVEMLKISDSFAEDDQKLLSIVLREIDGLNILISELLDYVKPITLDTEEVNLYQIIHEAIELVKIDTKNSVTFEGETEALYSGDLWKIKQVILNIMKNAIEEMDDSGGHLVIRLLKDESKSFRIEIEDDGPGIDEDDFDKIFEPFFTKKEGGTGIGLAICQNIIAMHSGEIIVKSKPKQTIFSIIL